MAAMLATVILLLLVILSANGQLTPPNSFPHVWPGQPKGPLSVAWQQYYEVPYPLPNLTGLALPRSFAGNIPVNRTGHPNDTLFFWGFERQGANGSLTAPAHANNSQPWIIWLQGGPGSSGMLGLSTENGPIHVLTNGSWVLNPYSWNTLADTIWIDQPVGTGFSTSDSKGYIADEDQMGEDFIAFLKNLVSVFPSLATRPLYITGESYAGTYIPYIVKHLFAQSKPPVNLKKIAIGDGSLGSFATIRHLPVLNILETYPAIIGYDQDVFNYFREQHHLCGFDLNLTYPQTGGNFPTLNLTQGLRAQFLVAAETSVAAVSSWREAIASAYSVCAGTKSAMKRADYHERRDLERLQWKRDISGRPNGTIDPWYGCDIFDEMRDYAVNFTFPWSNGGFDVYDVPDATHPEPSMDAGPFLNSLDVRAALHAPTSKNWSSSFNYPFGSVYNKSIGNEHGDPSVEPVAFLTPLFANASERNISFIFYSGNDDAQVQHRGTEVVIQNFTFGGVQGFSRKPATPWFDDDGNAAGIVHQERGLTYVLFTGAGHLVPQWKPAQALVFLREFVLGSNQNGTVVNSSTGEVVGGENKTLAEDFMPGGNEIFYGSAKTEGTSTIPSATIAAWESFIATATLDAVTLSSASMSSIVSNSTVPTSPSSAAPSSTGNPNSSARSAMDVPIIFIAVLLGMGLLV
ncbi:alpha/beta-hydrolase [Lentinus tigrinus ALCF2SS1-7]|uniref:alpha/beta-hydrolase n=1 Tax=Lentinus tigrinus ALCF2SS1-7 TaxID=1328758 RepID=UPI001165FD47|nr:alpha/beta-hydrolase [Lentinus tigrinus ALCF2SS1-7]